MDSLRNVIEKNVIYIGISFFVALALVFFLGVVVGPKISRGSYRMSAALPTPEAVSAKEPSLEEEPKKEAQEKEEPQTSTQAPETLKKDEAETAETIVPVPAAEEIFTLGEGIYRETSSAKGKIAVSGGRSWYDSERKGRWFAFSYTNISKEVLDTEWTVEWKDTEGNVLRTDKGRHYRLFPNDSHVPTELQYPEKAVSYEFWIKAERSKPIPASIGVNYIEHPTIEGKVSLNYELVVQNEGTPTERWAIEVEVKNTTTDKSFKDVSLYLRERNSAGEIISVKENSESGRTELFTEENFHLGRKQHVAAMPRPGGNEMLRPGESETFRILLPYETASFDFYLQGEEVSSFVEFISTSGEIKLEDYSIGGDFGSWLEFIPSSPGQMVKWEEHIFHSIITDSSGKVLRERDFYIYGEQFSKIGINLPLGAVKLQVIERLREQNQK